MIGEWIMQVPLVPIAVAALVTGLLLWLLLPLAARLGLVDRPGGRKVHARATPVIGGLAMASGVTAALIVPGFVPPVLAAFSAAAGLLMFVGTLDDLYDIRWHWRIMAQVVATLIMIYWGGVRVETIGMIFSHEPVQLGLLSVPFTVFATVSVINAVNMCDGVDGLAGTLSFLALGMLAAAAGYAGNTTLVAALLPMLGAIAAFLMFNLRLPWQREARVFMGNGGSAFLGFTIIWVAFRLTQNSAHPVSPVLAPWLMAAPLVDTVVLFVRRIAGGKSPFAADTEHLHHLLLAAGFTPGQLVVGLSALTCLLGLGASLLFAFDLVSATQLVVAFVAMTLAYFWLTMRRERAVAMFARLQRLLFGPARPVATPGHEDVKAISDNVARPMTAEIRIARTGGSRASPYPLPAADHEMHAEGNRIEGIRGRYGSVAPRATQQAELEVER